MTAKPATATVPRHVAIIMDGNGRWAQQRGLPRIEGHRAGAEAVRRMVAFAGDHGIHYLTLFAFSTENWQRPRTEVRGLMTLLRSFLKSTGKELQERHIRLNAIGELDQLPADIQATLTKMIAATSAGDRGTLTLALAYGSRAEITAAARQLGERVRRGELGPAEITEQDLAAGLYTADLPDPDLVIRTAGEMRLSNFLLWQASYAEFWVTETLWPDFDAEEFSRALADYCKRDRRFGGVQNA